MYTHMVQVRQHLYPLMQSQSIAPYNKPQAVYTSSLKLPNGAPWRVFCVLTGAMRHTKHINDIPIGGVFQRSL
jgi:hypothetical protein